jgi:hypothetical protein
MMCCWDECSLSGVASRQLRRQNQDLWAQDVHDADPPQPP